MGERARDLGRGRCWRVWSESLPDTEDDIKIRGYVTAPDGKQGFYEKRDGSFTFWEIGKGQDHGKLLEILWGKRIEEEKPDQDKEEIQRLVDLAHRLSEPKRGS